MSENKGYGSEQVKQIIGQWLDIKHKVEEDAK